MYFGHNVTIISTQHTHSRTPLGSGKMCKILPFLLTSLIDLTIKGIRAGYRQSWAVMQQAVTHYSNVIINFVRRYMITLHFVPRDKKLI